MRLLHCQTLSTEETLARFKETRLRGFGQPRIYEKASLELRPAVPTEKLIPTQRYVLTSDLNTIFALETLLLGHNIDIFALTGAVLLWLEREGEEEGPNPLTPPIIEDSQEANGQTVWIINDGMHRIAAARKRGRDINVILAQGVPTEYPYYAFPLENNWQDVVELAELPDNFAKKSYRSPDDYKSLFRDFNGVFEGIQKQRKKTN